MKALALLTFLCFSISYAQNKKPVSYASPLGIQEVALPKNNTFAAVTISSCPSSVVPPANVNGVDVTDDSTGDVGLYPPTYAICLGPETMPAYSIYLGQSSSFTYTLYFSQPVNNLVIAISGAGVVGGSTNENFIFVTNSGIPTIVANSSCFTTIVGNQILSGAGVTTATSNGGGGGIFTITAPNNFTSLVISGDGGQNGSLLSVCSNSVQPITPCLAGVAAPTLNAPALCGLTAVNLTAITATNLPSGTGVSLAWFSGTPPTAANQLTATQAASQPLDTTYYAAFYDSVNNCYSPTTAYFPSNTTLIPPTFTQVNPICIGTLLAALPTTSTNGINGSWAPTLNNTATTLYTFTPLAGQCADTAQMTITVNPKATPVFTLPNEICYGDAVAPFSVVSNQGITGLWSPSVNNTTSTTYTFNPNTNECANSTTFFLTVNQRPIVHIEGACNGKDFVLTAVSDIVANVTYHWYDAAHILLGSDASLLLTHIGMYQLVVTNVTCDGTASSNVVNIFCGIQKGISPNNDGLNDFFELSNLEVSTLSIFNRYGMKVYSKADYKNEWDGNTDGGTALPDGVYYYYIDFKNGENKTGWIYLNREY